MATWSQRLEMIIGRDEAMADSLGKERNGRLNDARIKI